MYVLICSSIISLPPNSYNSGRLWGMSHSLPSGMVNNTHLHLQNITFSQKNPYLLCSVLCLWWWWWCLEVLENWGVSSIDKNIVRFPVKPVLSIIIIVIIPYHPLSAVLTILFDYGILQSYYVCYYVYIYILRLYWCSVWRRKLIVCVFSSILYIPLFLGSSPCPPPPQLLLLLTLLQSIKNINHHHQTPSWTNWTHMHKQNTWTICF